jgi:hypothetical protein
MSFIKLKPQHEIVRGELPYYVQDRTVLVADNTSLKLYFSDKHTMKIYFKSRGVKGVSQLNKKPPFAWNGYHITKIKLSEL